MTTRIRFAATAGVAFTALALASGSLRAQTDGANWYPYLGCWEPVAEAGPNLCVRPTIEGVEFVRIADEQIVSREALSTRPDGVRSEREGCEGRHHAAFSSDGQRVFLTSDFVCEGGGIRQETGVLALTAADELLDVRSVEIDGDDVAWVQRYRPAPASLGRDLGIADLPRPGMAVATARQAASRSIDVDDVTEAVDAVGSGAVEAWVAESGDRFDLDAETLLALADDGVPEPVIDLMIAVSYPRRFALSVEDGVSMESAARDGFGPRPGWAPVGFGLGFGPGFCYDPLLFGCGFGYRSSLYSFGPLGWAGGWYGRYNPGIVVIDGGDRPGGRGRVVRGRGYTRGDRGGATGSGSTGSAVPTRRGGAAAGSGGRASTGRRAKPRRGGGGGGGAGLLF